MVYGLLIVKTFTLLFFHRDAPDSELYIAVSKSWGEKGQ